MAETLIPQKQVITIQENKEIVALLNSKPFNESLTLVTLHQMDSFSLGDLLSKIFDYLDDPNSKTKERIFNSKKTPPVQIIYKVTEFLKVLGYECSFDEAWSNGLLSGDSKVIYPIFYYLLVNLKVLTKRAYLGKYMVSLEIPIEFSEDPQIKKLVEQNKQCQAEFQVVYEGKQIVSQTSLNPDDLSKSIQQMEQQKEQLNAKIKEKKMNSANKPDFAPLFQATNLLRKEQEEQARLIDKIQSQRAQLQNAEAQLMSIQQSLMDAQKSLAPSNTPQQMLQATKSEVRKNRELVKERMTLQYNERLRKLQNTEKMLAEPPITQNQLLSIQQQMISTRRLVAQMEEKLSKENTQGDKLGIFKSQAAAVTKKKQQTIQSLKKQEQQLESLQNQIRKKQEQIHKLQPSMNMNTSEKYLQVIKDKKAKFTKKQAQLQQIRQQLGNLKRTEDILVKQKASYKSSYGLQQASQEHNLANASMQEINKQIDKLLDQIKKKKTELAPLFEQKKKLLEQFQVIEREHKQKKQVFETTISNVEQEMKDVETRVGKIKDEVYSIDTKIQLGRFKTQALQLKIDRLTEESQNIQGKGKKVGGGFSSYQQYFKKKTADREKEVTQLTAQRQIVSDNHQPSLQQNKMFLDLKKLLQVKLQAGKASGDAPRKGEKHGANVNVLRMQ